MEDRGLESLLWERCERDGERTGGLSELGEMAVCDAPFCAGDDGPEWWNLSEAWRELLFPSDVLLFRSSADKIGSSGNLLLFMSSFNRSSISNRFSISDGVTPVEAMEPEEG